MNVSNDKKLKLADLTEHPHYNIISVFMDRLNVNNIAIKQIKIENNYIFTIYGYKAYFHNHAYYENINNILQSIAKQLKLKCIGIAIDFDGDNWHSNVIIM